MTVREAIQALLDGRTLARDEARAAMREIMAGEATAAQIAGFLVALRAKGEAAAEIAGCAEAMREHVLAVTPRRECVIDIVGTGGDGRATLNISTAAALVAAAAGAAVAKHGNRAVSSRSGAADVLEALGFMLDQSPERVAGSIDTLGFGFMFAPAHHPAMRHAAPVRRELGVRTVFNIIGPLTNPAGATGGVFGVYAAALAPTFAAALAELGTRHALVVHGFGGIDELSPCGPNDVFEVREGSITQTVVDPAALGLAAADPSALTGGTAAENAAELRAILAGSCDGPKRDAIALNAGAALVTAGIAGTIAEGMALGQDTITNGEALDRLNALVAFSQGGRD